MLHLLLLSLLVTTPDPSTRTHAWRVVDQVSGSYKCEYACSTAAVDAARDTACIQSALDVVSASAGVKWNSLELPSGSCHINAALKVPVAPGTNGAIEIFGHGPPWTTSRAVFANSGWNSDTVIRGTVLRSSLTTGAVLTLGTDTTITAVNAGTNVITLASSTGFSVDDGITFRNDLDSSQPTPIAVGTGYYIKSKSGDDITISASYQGAVFDVTGTQTGTAHVTNSPGGRWLLHDFAILGSGDTDVKGIQIVGGGGTALVDMQGVTFANLAIGLDLATAEDGTAQGLAFYGNAIGFMADGATNSNVWTGIDCGANQTCGVVKGSVNTFFGGTVQGTVNYGLRLLGGENHVTGFYFEDATTTGAAISDERSNSWIIRSIASNTLTLDGPAPANDTQVYVWVDGSSSTMPGGVSVSTVYYVANSSGVTCKLRTASGGGGSLVGSSSGTGNVRMTVTAQEAGYNVISDNHYGVSGDRISEWKSFSEINQIDMSQQIKLWDKTVSNVVKSAAACTDLGDGNVCGLGANGNGGISYAFSPASVGSPGLWFSGAPNMYLNMLTAAGLSFAWECRDALGYCQFRDTTNDKAFLAINPHNAGADDNEVAVKSNHFTVEHLATVDENLTVNDTVFTDTITSLGGTTTVEGVAISSGTVDGVDVATLNTLATTLATGIRDVKATCGAVGDGTTDDTVAIDACIAGTPSGGSIYFPPGVYRTTGPLALPAPIALRGPGVPSASSMPAYANAGWASVTYSGAVIRSAVTSGNILTTGPMAAHLVTIENLGFASTVSGAHTTAGIYADGTSLAQPRLYLHNVAFYNLHDGLDCFSCTGSEFDHVLFGGDDFGVYLDVNSLGNTFTSPYVYLTGDTGFYVLGNQNTIQGGFVYSSATRGFYVTGSGNTIDGVLFQTGAAVMVSSAGKGNVLGRNTYLDTNAVSVAGSGNRVWRDGGYACPAITWASGAAYNIADDTEYNAGCTLTDNSTNTTNTRTYPDATGVFFSRNITATSAAIGGASISDGDFSTAATGDYVKTDHVEEYTAANGVQIDSSAGATATVKIKDGYAYVLGAVELNDAKQWIKFNASTLTTDIDGDDVVTITADNSTTIDTPTTYVGISGVGALSVGHVTINYSGGNVPREIYNAYLLLTTAGTGVEDTKTITLPAGLMATDGDAIVVTAYVECEATANNKTFALHFNGSDYETSTQACNGNSWHLEGEFQRIDSGHMAWFGRMDYAGNLGVLHSYQGDAITWANAQDLVLRLTTPTTPGDATLRNLRITYHPGVP